VVRVFDPNNKNLWSQPGVSQTSAEEGKAEHPGKKKTPDVGQRKRGRGAGNERRFRDGLSGEKSLEKSKEKEGNLHRKAFLQNHVQVPGGGGGPCRQQ